MVLKCGFLSITFTKITLIISVILFYFISLLYQIVFVILRNKVAIVCFDCTIEFASLVPFCYREIDRSKKE